jgi:hypothetical protein
LLIIVYLFHSAMQATTILLILHVLMLVLPSDALCSQASTRIKCATDRILKLGN